MSTSGQAEDHAVPMEYLWIALLMCQNDEDLPAKDKIPRAKVDAQLIKDMLQHVGVCAEEPKLLFVKTEQEVIDGLKAATDCMKECAVLRLLVCYFGHGYCRSFNGSTWMELQENVTLECTVRRELRKAKLEKAKQVVIADCCQPLRVWAPGDSDQEWQHGLSGLYSAEKNKMTGDTGHFAHALAYCLSCQPSSLSELFSDVQDLVRQLTFFRQQCEFVYRSSQTKIRLFPGKPYAEPLAAVSEIDLQEFPKLFHSPLFFLARWLCELSGNELRRLNVKPSMFRKETDEIIRLMKDIFDQLKEKACLFTGNQWFQQLNLVYDCSDLNEVLKWLQKRPVPPESQDALSQEQLCRPCYITPDIQQFLLESLREAVKDEFDDRFAQNDDEGTNDESEADDKFEDSNGRPTVKAAAELWEHLSEYFYVSNHKLFDTDKGTQMTFTYAIYAEGVHGIEQAKERLQEIRSEIDELSEVFGIDTANFKLFLCPGSLWIIIRSDTILQQLKEFMDGLAKWYEERCDADAHWERTKSPRQVKLSTVPQRLLDLVLQVENYVDVGSCMWLHAEDVQKHSLKRLNVEVGREHGGRLQEWQVAVFEGDIEAKGTSWLQGHGGLRLVVLRRSWRVLDLPSDLRSDLEKLADDRQWQQDFTFHAAAFVMHIEQKGFEQSNFSTRALSPNECSKDQTPQDFLRMVLREVFALKSSARGYLGGVAPTSRWIGVVISQEDEEAPGASFDASLIQRVLQHVGLCVEPLIALPNKTKEEVLRRLDEAAELMKRRGANHLLVCYFGHGYLRHWGSTWVQLKDIHGEDSPLSLECSVTAALRRAKLEWTKQVIIADCCRTVEASEFDGYHSDSDVNDEELSVRFPQQCLYAAEEGYHTGNTGHFAAALAYCLLGRPPSVSELFTDVKDLVAQLTCFCRQCESDDQSNSNRMNIHLFPDSCVRPLRAVSHEDFEKFKGRFEYELFFLARWLCELSGNELRRLKVEPSMRREETDEIIRLMKDIFDQLKEKARLFTGNLWSQQLNLIHDCKDLHRVLEWLQELPVPPENQDVSQEQLCRPCYITADIQECLLESLRKAVKDEFDAPKEKEVKDGFDKQISNLPDDPEGPSCVKKAALLWENLSRFFEECDGKLFETSEGIVMKCTYAICLEGDKEIEYCGGSATAEKSFCEEDMKLQRLANSINELSKVFDADTKKYRVFLEPICE